jgi:hypothetical protein
MEGHAIRWKLHLMEWFHDYQMISDAAKCVLLFNEW